MIYLLTISLIVNIWCVYNLLSIYNQSNNNFKKINNNFTIIATEMASLALVTDRLLNERLNND